jgi:hypothetical protein
MKKTKLTFVILVLFVVTLFIGCKSTPIKFASTIEEAFPDRIEKTVMGMSLNDFKTVWSEVKRSGISEDSEIYEFTYYCVSLDRPIYTYFYFINNVLVKYESKK